MLRGISALPLRPNCSGFLKLLMGLTESAATFATMAGRVDDLLAAPLGRQLVYATLGFTTLELYDRCGLGSPAGTAMLSRPGSKSASAPPVRRTTWSEVSAQEARQAIRSMVAAGRWHAVDEMSELEMLSWIAETGSFGFGGEDEWLWGLTTMAADELIPVAERLLSCPAAANWSRPLVADDQRILAFDGWDTYLGRDLGAAISAATGRHKEENASRATYRPDEETHARDEANGVRYGAYWWSTPKAQ